MAAFVRLSDRERPKRRRQVLPGERSCRRPASLLPIEAFAVDVLILQSGPKLIVAIGGSGVDGVHHGATKDSGDARSWLPTAAFGGYGCTRGTKTNRTRS